MGLVEKNFGNSPGKTDGNILKNRNYLDFLLIVFAEWPRNLS